MSNYEFFLNINHNFYKISLDRPREKCVVPGNMITARLKVQKVEDVEEETGQGLIESIAEECLLDFLNKKTPSPFIYFSTKTIAISEYKIQLYIDSYRTHICETFTI